MICPKCNTKAKTVGQKDTRRYHLCPTHGKFVSVDYEFDCWQVNHDIPYTDKKRVYQKLKLLNDIYGNRFSSEALEQARQKTGVYKQ